MPGPSSNSLRTFALRLPGTDEGVACEGTVIEKRTIRAGGKAFLFLGRADAMLKLRESLPDAVRAAAKSAGRLKAGKTGWVTVPLEGGSFVAPAVLERWIEESYRLIAPRATAAAPPAKPAKRRAAAKRARN